MSFCSCFSLPVMHHALGIKLLGIRLTGSGNQVAWRRQLWRPSWFACFSVCWQPAASCTAFLTFCCDSGWHRSALLLPPPCEASLGQRRVACHLGTCMDMLGIDELALTSYCLFCVGVNLLEQIICLQVYASQILILTREASIHGWVDGQMVGG